MTAKDIACEIYNQIPRNVFWCWGAIKSKKNPHPFISLDETKERMGGLMFAFYNCPKVRKGKVVIELNYSDLYNITIYKKVRRKNEYGMFSEELEVVSKVEDYYADMVVNHIDEVIG